MKRKVNRKNITILVIASILIVLANHLFFSPKPPTKEKKKKTKNAITSINYYIPSYKKRYPDYKTNHPEL